MKSNKEILSDYLPEKSVNVALSWIEKSNVQLKITRKRSSKLGDYRPPVHKKFHRISVNSDLNKYNFLITLVHEFAHLKVWENYQRKVKPHGSEWKTAFKELMEFFFAEDVFPSDLKAVLQQYIINPTSSSMNTRLTKKLREYDDVKSYLTLEDIPANTCFRIYNGIIFEKMEKLQKRFKCKRLDNNRIYLVSPIIEVTPVNMNKF